MLDYQKFKKKYLESLYSIHEIDDEVIGMDYKLFLEGVDDAEHMAMSMLKSEGINLSHETMMDTLESTGYLTNQYELILLDSVISFLESVYGNETLDGSGRCLLSNLVGRACQMIHNEDMLGVVRDYDKNKRNLLFVDFGDTDLVKIDIDELRIVGQKK